MINQLQSRLEDNTALRDVALALLALAVGAAGGLAIVVGNPLLPFAALAGLLALPWLVTRPLVALALVVATVTLLPFATSPVRLAVLTPTLLEVGLLLVYVAWLLRALLNPGEGLARTPLDGWLLLFLGSTLFSFVLGLGRDASTDVIHNYFKLILAVSVFFAVANIVRTPEAVGLVLKLVMLLGAGAGALGIALWGLPDSLAARLLSRLGVVGYPSSGVIRYIEDNPALGERAIGTQVDPNSFGGMLVVVAVVTGVQLLSRKPLLSRWLLAGMLMVEVTALVLTQSRAALAGLLVAGALVGTLRYRRLWVWGVAGAAAIVLLVVGSGYMARLAIGLRFEDQANLMRLAEYRNALDIIGRYPAFGVGFGTAGELDLTTGASSIYFTIAERAGLLGLALFLITAVIFFAHLLPAIRASLRQAPLPGSAGESSWSTLDSALLGGAAAILGALVVGIADHYYFNIEFPHMVALFWLMAAITLVAYRLLNSQVGEERGLESN